MRREPEAPSCNVYDANNRLIAVMTRKMVRNPKTGQMEEKTIRTAVSS